MCRKNQLCGSALIAFGVGVLFGMLMEAGFFCGFIGLAIMSLGIWCLWKK